MKTLVRLTMGTALVALAALWQTAPAQAGGNVDVFAGQKEVDTNFGEGHDMQEQDALALLTDWGGDNWPVHIAVDMLTGNKDVNGDDFNPDIDGSTGEFDVGVRWYPAKGSHWMPHLGGGVGLISGKVRVNNEDPNDPNDDFGFDDSKLGYWADTGLAYRMGDHFKLGGRVRYSAAKFDNVTGPGGTEEVDAGGVAYGVNAGWTW